MSVVALACGRRREAQDWGIEEAREGVLFLFRFRTVAATTLASVLTAAMASAALAQGRHTKTSSTPASSHFLKVERAKRAVVFTVLAGDGTANGGLDFDNTYDGQLTLTVPVNWTVDVVFKNVGGLPHSVLFDAWTTSLSDANPTPAFKGASSPSPIVGTPPGGHANFRFKADKVGRFRMVCAFPGHAVSGMWDAFVVSKTATTASLKG